MMDTDGQRYCGYLLLHKATVRFASLQRICHVVLLLHNGIRRCNYLAIYKLFSCVHAHVCYVTLVMASLFSLFVFH